MKIKLLITLILISLVTSGCTLDTSGRLSIEVWIDAPLNGAYVVVNNPVAIMAHANYRVDRMLLLVNGTPFTELAVTQVSENLWEGAGMWTPVATGSYDLRVRGLSARGQRDSGKARVNVLETRSFPMEYATATPTLPAILWPTPTGTFTSLPPAQVNFWADSLSIVGGNCTILHWEVAYATGVYLNGEFVAQLGDRQVCPPETTSYTLHVEAPAGNVDQQIIISVVPPTRQPTPTLRPTVTPKPPTATTPPDTTGPSLSDIAHTPEFIFDGSTCGPISVQISAKASDPSGIAKVDVYYRVVKGSTQGAWRSLPMSHVSGKKYQATLGPNELKASLNNYGGGMVEYTVRSWDNPGNMTQIGPKSFEAKMCLI